MRHMPARLVRLALLVIIAALLAPATSGARPDTPPQPGDESSQVTLEDFSDILTSMDLGFNDFSGNMGAINGQFVTAMDLTCPSEEESCYLRFAWDFASQREVFTGLFFSLFGLTDTQATFDGETVVSIPFPEHSLNLEDVDHGLDGPVPPRRFTQICTTVTYANGEDLQLRLELKDADGALRFTRTTIPASPESQTHCWDIAGSPDDAKSDVPLAFDPRRAKVFTLLVEREHAGDGIANPVQGTLDIHRIWFVADAPEVRPIEDDELLDLLEFRAYQYFHDWSSRKPESQDIPQDRSTFGDLLTVGGIGFALPAHVIAAERGWITRADAAQRVLAVLRVLDQPSLMGPERVGKLGYQGWLYHFLGVDGRRKLNFDFPETIDVDESLNTVELSTIDTGLAVMGILIAQSYFDDPANPAEVEISQRAQAIYDRVNWPFMLEPASQQLYLGWKPIEPREGPSFEIPDATGDGHYSGVPGDPATLDYYTDEALIALILGIGSPTYPLPPDTFYSLIMEPDEGGLVRTYPGSLFTYQFRHAFMDTRRYPACGPVDWYANSREAIWRTIAYAEDNPKGFATYGPNAWGLSAAEGPYDAYHAYGAPTVAIADPPEEDGTVTYYAMLSAVSFGDDLRQRAVAALNAAWDRGFWHPRFALPDAFNDEVSQALLDINAKDEALRQSGAWLQRALFAIDQGPMLLHLENARSGLIWDLAARNPNIRRAMLRLCPQTYLPLLVHERGVDP
jgi:hypothetical protein